MRNKLRIVKNPTRSYSGPELNNHRDYINFLRKDFNYRCGYCDVCEPTEGKENFEIDHFIPIAVKPELKTKYSNLIYSCKTCNRSKREKTIDLNPIENDYEEHFCRCQYGKILPITDVGEDTWKKLKFYLLKRKYSWQISKLIYLQQKLLRLKINLDPNAIKEFEEFETSYNELMTYIGEIMIKKNTLLDDPEYILMD